MYVSERKMARTVTKPSGHNLPFSLKKLLILCPRKTQLTFIAVERLNTMNQVSKEASEKNRPALALLQRFLKYNSPPWLAKVVPVAVPFFVMEGGVTTQEPEELDEPAHYTSIQFAGKASKEEFETAGCYHQTQK
jgi:hypothetical protein